MRALRRSRDEGAAAVEFALILIPLLTLVFGIIAFGWGLARWVSLTGAAREGARHMAIYGVAGSPTAGGAFSEASNRALASAGLACGAGGAGCTIPAVGPCTPGPTSEVVFSVTMTQLVPITLPFIPMPTSGVTATAVMRCGG